jgi:hypothetical protein
MKKVLSYATEMVNFIKQRPVHSRMLKKNWKNLDKLAHKSPATYRNLVA